MEAVIYMILLIMGSPQNALLLLLLHLPILVLVLMMISPRRYPTVEEQIVGHLYPV